MTKEEFKAKQAGLKNRYDAQVITIEKAKEAIGSSKLKYAQEKLHLKEIENEIKKLKLKYKTK